ncbi:hypothetical protein ACH41E_34845, partial [Streptomyces sp. NPDC020412]|uniref:hypothetical protein n=1 Tax=Streptomyces sp. NPDC020412 TaxID=3365073 RepID=UPI0037BB4BA8
YLALTFGTLLSSQGTDASFKSLSGPSGLFPSILRFQPYQIFFPARFRTWLSIRRPIGVAFCLSA